MTVNIEISHSLTKRTVGKRFCFTLKNEQGDIIGERYSTQPYTLCTLNGEYFFTAERFIDLSRGLHQRIVEVSDRIANPRKYYPKVSVEARISLTDFDKAELYDLTHFARLI